MESLHISALFERAGEFDLIHNSFDFLPLTYSGLVETPVVTTVHGFSSERIVAVYEKYDDRGYYVAISEADRHPKLHYIATIHHGIDMAAFEARTAPGTYLLFFGRIHPDKGTAAAIDVAERAGLPLTIAGIIQDREYFERLRGAAAGWGAGQVHRPCRAGGSRRAAGGRPGPAAPHRLRGALRIQRRRGHGLRHTGHRQCPGVDAGDRPPGEGGYLVNSLDEAVAAVHASGDIDRLAVRASVERRFDVQRMVDEYLDVYQRVIAQRQAVGRRLDAG